LEGSVQGLIEELEIYLEGPKETVMNLSLKTGVLVRVQTEYSQIHVQTVAATVAVLLGVSASV
jgi:hypothetical protein